MIARTIRVAAISLLIAFTWFSLLEPPNRRVEPDFFSSLASIRLSYEPFSTLEEYLDIAHVSVIGRLEDVSLGRAVGGERGQRGTSERVLIRVRVLEVVSGSLPSEDRDDLHLELLKPHLVSVSELDASLPKQDVLLILQDLTNIWKPSVVDERGVQRDPHRALYSPPTPKGLFIEREGHVITPLDEAPGQFDSGLAARNLEELAAAIRAAES